MQLSLQRQRLKAVDEKLPAQSRNVFLQEVQQEKFAENDGPIPDNGVKLEVQTQTQTLQSQQVHKHNKKIILLNIDQDVHTLKSVLSTLSTSSFKQFDKDKISSCRPKGEHSQKLDTSSLYKL